ncbi:MAG: DNA-3-methyladenine glycosylase 2 family protein [Candidatus Bathyarchaeia archaeon]|jgi:DNA-3-methyladenine glycosylase II
MPKNGSNIVAQYSSASFPNIGSPHTFRLGVDHVSKSDPNIRTLVKKIGVIDFHLDGDPFESLVEAIISQQLNGAVARTIFGRLKAMVNSETITAESLGRVPVPKMRKAGVSPQKIRYLKDLTSRILGGKLNLHDLKRRPDDEIIRQLDEVKGIGPWTAHMFLLFTLGRTDVLPVDDLGIQKSIQRVYSLRKRPNAERINKIADSWHPYCSIASLYLWHAKDT